jgi:hypothetical protein
LEKVGKHFKKLALPGDLKKNRRSKEEHFLHRPILQRKILYITGIDGYYDPDTVSAVLRILTLTLCRSGSRSSFLGECGSGSRYYKKKRFFSKTNAM